MLKKREDVFRKVAKFFRRFYGGGNNFATLKSHFFSLAFEVSLSNFVSLLITDFRQMIGSHAIRT